MSAEKYRGERTKTQNELKFRVSGKRVDRGKKFDPTGLLFSMGSGVGGLANPCSSEAGSDRLRFAKPTKMRVFITFALFGFYKSH
jgi:hypothetical protein